MRTEAAYLRDILDACFSIADRVEGFDFESFKSSQMLQDSVHYRPMVIGEATRYLSEATQLLMPEIPWPQIKRMRNILVHDYLGVDLVVSWDVVKNHLPQLVNAIQHALPTED